MEGSLAEEEIALRVTVLVEAEAAAMAESDEREVFDQRPERESW